MIKYLILIALLFSSVLKAEPSTYKKPSLGFEISNPHNLEWYKTDQRKELSQNEDDKKNGIVNTLFVLGYKSKDIAQGAIAVNYTQDYDNTKPIRYYLGRIISKIRMKEGDDVLVEGDYEKLTISGVEAIYYKAEPEYADPRGVLVNAHIYVFQHAGNLFMFQSGVNVKNDIDKEIINDEFLKFQTVVEDTVNTINLH